ncbi:MAG: hypothetical protein OCD02_05160 [Spirochaetaceae bacterium]
MYKRFVDRIDNELNKRIAGYEEFLNRNQLVEEGRENSFSSWSKKFIKYFIQINDSVYPNSGHIRLWCT